MSPKKDCVTRTALSIVGNTNCKIKHMSGQLLAKKHGVYSSRGVHMLELSVFMYYLVCATVPNVKLKVVNLPVKLTVHLLHVAVESVL